MKKIVTIAILLGLIAISLLQSVSAQVTYPESDVPTSAIMATIVLIVFVITNIVFLGVVHSAMVRFLFALLTLMIGIASLTVQAITFSPYLQMVTVVMSLLCMVLAAKAKG